MVKTLFGRRLLTRTHFLILTVLLVAAFVLNYLNYTTTTSVCGIGVGINCTYSENYLYLKYVSYVSLVSAIVFALWLFLVFDRYIEEYEEETDEEVYDSFYVLEEEQTKKELFEDIDKRIEEEQAKILVIEEEHVSTINKRFEPFEKASTGFYGENDQQDVPTGRSIAHEEGRLPRVTKDGNYWLGITEEQHKNYILLDYSQYTLYKPGWKVEPGYYLEIDENYESCERYIYQAVKLPPTRKKGHFWIWIGEKGAQIEITDKRAFTNREVKLSKDTADAGFYIEVESNGNSTGRLIEHLGGKLPTVLKEGNNWVLLQEEEKDEMKILDYSQYDFHKPGYKVEPGYYLEIDENFESCERYIYQAKKLPPTRKSGHYWVKVEDSEVDTNKH